MNRIERSACRAGALLVALFSVTAAGAQLPVRRSAGVGAASAPMARAEPRLRDLICRGGASGLEFRRHAAPSPRSRDMVTVALSFRPSRTEAGGDGQGLEPGTCSWPFRDAAPPEPQLVYFDTPANAQLKQKQHGSAVDNSPTAAASWPDAHTIPVYLSDPGRYWRFFVWDSAAAPVVPASMHSAWRAPVGAQVAQRPTDSPAPARPSSRPTPLGRSGVGAAREPGRQEVGHTALWQIHDVQVSTGAQGVVIRFRARPDASPTVKINRQPPGQIPNSTLWTFTGNPASLTVQGTRSGATGRYVAAGGPPLERGTRYYYIIDVPGAGAGAPAQQHRGEFTTLAQRVEIVIDDIYVLSDGDSDNEGEFIFTLLGCGWPADRSEGLSAGTLGYRGWGDGARRRNQRHLELQSPHAPDRIEIVMLAEESDAIAGGSVREWSCASVPAGPGTGGNIEWNVARAEVDLRQVPGRSASAPITLRSALPRNGTTVMFEARGHITITRQ